ncbi:hypothetical protein DFR86_05015 [Acidianus sulfidivorans JP7]|uniref:Uncharacterized protein n=1 Tax=Acidianus sulfidivorans JP7 TaxID=619593 RepID=A0A2U9ILT4_9CREN|nr:hypothetical protein [Acidianus sulfidivorans]AWR96981.1 hypothetical protein DFR86_05015 [Acidianus sulfidivorans JP7]
MYEEISSKSIYELLNSSAEFDYTKEEFFQVLDIIYKKAKEEGLTILGPYLSTEKGLNVLKYIIKRNNEKEGEINFYYGSNYLKYKHYLKFSRS